MNSQPTPFAKIEQIVREDFGPRAEALLSKMDRVPASTASIGQVHRAGGLAVKVLHPGIEQAIRSDFKAAAAGRVLAKLVPLTRPSEELKAMLHFASMFWKAARGMIGGRHEDP